MCLGCLFPKNILHYSLVLGHIYKINWEVEPEPELGMGVPYITQFCCCMGLEVGAKAVGYLHLAASICFTILCSIFTSDAHDKKDTVDDMGDNLYTKIYTIALVVTIVSVVHILLACLLLLGAYKRNTNLLRVWVWVMSALFVSAIVFVVVAAARGFSASGSDIFIAFAEGVLFFAVVAYCILCVNSYYLKLKSCEDMEGPAKSNY
ncbi:uncharacterized protein LOC106137938 isoform X1 [Amyelois transitella]|uniref:uncharacterized protein LOC106137938 isoform X1 n=1 Tax=Amyelois transitella TaxID=680683 RepID=UPI00298FBF0F|nr:uncharacterized protein LOC106137938 isoform X1 [Amyelois transitella]